MLGEARLTHDLDFLIFLTSGDVPAFLRQAKAHGFAADVRAVQRQLRETGVFRLIYRGIPIDCLTASTALEEKMWRRSRRLRLHGRLARFPSPEDLILLKLLPGRPKDLLDMEGVLIRQRGHLDVEYLKVTAQRMAGELQDAGLWHQLQSLLAKNP